MKIALKKSYLLFAIYFLVSSAFCFSENSRFDFKQEKRVLELVNKAKIFIEQMGTERAFEEFNKRKGKFTKKADYIFAVDYNGIFLATINYPNLIGTNQLNLQDSSGVYLVKEEIDKAKSGGGWLKGRLKKNPHTDKHECKASYILPMPGDYFIGSGYYYQADNHGNC